MKKTIILAAVIVCMSCYESLQASIVKFEKNLEWASLRDLTSSEFSKNFKKYKNKGYMIIDVDAYSTTRGTRYSMIWRKNTDNRGWAEYRDMTSDQYSARWKEFKNKGYRPLDIESYRVGGKQRFAGIWVQNKEGYAWSSKRNLKSKEYGDYFKEQKNKGYRIVDMEAYNTAGGLRYAAIWVKNKENIAWAQLRDMSRSSYQSELNKRSRQGYIVTDYESYRKGTKKYYAAIWEKRSGYATQVRTNRDEKGFANLWREYKDKGYRLVDFERDGSDYGGIWVENASRYRYSKKSQIDNLVSRYRKDRDLPGISVSIIKNGTSIYQRGFGYANKRTKKVAHSGSIYLSASISKAIGGTIAVKMAEEGRLRNGRRVSLDLSKKTRDYLTNVPQSKGSRVTLPSRHQHTVEQLFAHLGCISHYDNSPEPTTKQYNKAIDALPQIWNAPFVEDCDRGDDRNYSTHAFTYLAAVMEKVSNKSSAELVKSELADPYGLSTMRAMYESRSVPSKYDRVTPYNDSNLPTSHSNNSWKIWGGGVETSTNDLARFGWLLLNGTILKPQARDNVLWKRVNSNKKHGIAWDIENESGTNRRTAHHGGSWSGTKTFLQIYRDDALVIAVMTNRKDQRGGSLETLTKDIANIVLQ